MWGHPRQSGHGGEVWQHVVHWRREWQTTSVFLPWEPYEQYEKGLLGIVNDNGVWGKLMVQKTAQVKGEHSPQSFQIESSEHTVT